VSVSYFSFSDRVKRLAPFPLERGAALALDRLWR